MTDAWPVVTEPFRQWVIENRFPQGRPDWERFGVTMVADVAPFETMKLRLLNGAHSAIAYLGQLLGLETVADAFGASAIRQFIDGLWNELIPTLPHDKALDPQSYIAELAARFSNTALKHRTAQIANDGSQKLPQRIVEAAIERSSLNQSVDHLALVIAAWIAALRLRKLEMKFSDPLDPQLDAATVESIFAITGFAKSAPQKQDLMRLVTRHLNAIESIGPEQALIRLTTKGTAE